MVFETRENLDKGEHFGEYITINIYIIFFKMQVQAVQAVQAKRTITLQDLDQRLGNVETSLRDILQNGEATREEFNERLIDIKDEMENLNHSVKKVKMSMSYRPTTIMFVIVFFLVVWTTIIHMY